MRERSGDPGADHPPAIRIEIEAGWAYCGERRLDLTPKEFAVLRYLAERPGRLVTKDDLLGAAWSDTVVSEAALTSCIRDLRRALGESSQAPRYLQTVHRRGFRFIGPVVEPASEGGVARRPSAADPVAPGAPALVGREAELVRLRACFDVAASGRRQVVFVTGEAGIGKTALVERFVAEIAAVDGLRIGRGQCVEQYGAGEPYLPILEALGRLGRQAGGAELVATLRRYAPTWLAQLPGLLTDEEIASVQARARGTTGDRTLRELIEALDVASRDAPLVLVLEDLHWCDSATTEVLAMIARRRDPARLLVLGTFRPADVAIAGHPLNGVKQELRLHGRCEEITPAFLDDAAIAAYLAMRFPAASFPASLAGILRRNTNGNPLFLVNVVADLLEREHLRDAGGRWELALPPDQVMATVPESLSQMVENHVDRLAPEERTILTVASAAGMEFSAAVTAAEGLEPVQSERACDALARRGLFLARIGVDEWPDGTIATRYRFIHALYQNVLYGRIPIGRRVGLHLRIGAWLERAYGPRADDVAGELAMHFEQGRDFERAVRYHRSAADAALRHHGHREATAHATRALELLGALPASPETVQQELAIRTILGSALVAKGWAAPEVADTYARARELSTQGAAAMQSFPVLIGLFGFHMSRSELGQAREVAEQLAALATTTDDDAVRLGASSAAGMVAFATGEFASALVHLERSLEIYDPARHSPDRSSTIWVGQDLGVSSAVNAAWVDWILGNPDRGEARMREGVARARALGHPFTLALSGHIAATFCQSIGDVDSVRALADVVGTNASDRGFDMFSTLGAVHDGWVRFERGDEARGIADMHAGLAAYRATGAGFGVPTLQAILAEAYGRTGRPAEGLAVLADARAVVAENGTRYWDAELRRIEGLLLLPPADEGGSGDGVAAAEAHMLEALEIARRQEARMFALRAAVSLARLWRARGRDAQARTVLSEHCAGFREDMENAEVRDARALLTAPARPRPREKRLRASRS